MIKEIFLNDKYHLFIQEYNGGDVCIELIHTPTGNEVNIGHLITKKERKSDNIKEIVINKIINAFFGGKINGKDTKRG